MAIDATTHGLTQFQMAYAKEGTLGTAALTDGGLETGLLIDIESPPTIGRPTNRQMTVKSGVGRTLKKSDVYVSQYGIEKEWTFTAFHDTINAKNFLENCTGVAVGTSPASYDIVYNYTGPECKTGDTDTDYTGAITFAWVNPESGYTEVLPGAVIASLRFYSSQSDEDKRGKFDVTVRSRFNIIDSVDDSGWTLTPYGTTYRSICSLKSATSVTQIDGADVVMNSYDVTFNANPMFYGVGENCEPEVIARGIPEFEVLGTFGVKYDTNTAPLFEKIKTQNDIVVAMHNAVWASSTFGFLGSYGQITDAFDITDVDSGAFIDVPFKFAASTSGDLFQMVP